MRRDVTSLVGGAVSGWCGAVGLLAVCLASCIADPPPERPPDATGSEEGTTDGSDATTTGADGGSPHDGGDDGTEEPEDDADPVGDAGGDSTSDTGGIDEDDGADGDGACGAECFSGERTSIGLFGGGGDDVATDVAVAGDGSRYAVGFTDEAFGDGDYAGGFSDAFVAKLDASWSVDWARMVGTLGSDEARGVDVGPGGDVYVTGFVDGDVGDQSAAGGKDGFVARYNPSGERQWIRLVGSDFDDVARAVGVDSQGRVHIAGAAGDDIESVTHNGGTDDAFLARYAPGGERQDLRLIGTDGGDVAHDLAVGPGDAIYLAGVTDEGLGGRTPKGRSSDGFVVRYASGSRDWVRLVGTPDEDAAHAVAAGAATVYVGGITDGEFDDAPSGGLEDGFVASIGESGDPGWVATVASDDDDAIRGLAVDGSGRVHAAGEVAAEIDGRGEVAGVADGFVAYYRSSGERSGLSMIRSDRDDVARGVAVQGRSVTVVGEAGESVDGTTFGGGLSDAFAAEYR